MLLANEERGGTHYLPYVHEPEFLYVVATQLMPRHFLRCFFNSLGNSEWLPLVFKKRSITSDIITTVKRVRWQPMFYLMKTILNRTERKHQYLLCPSSPSVLPFVVPRESHSAQKKRSGGRSHISSFPFFSKISAINLFPPDWAQWFPPSSKQDVVDHFRNKLRTFLRKEKRESNSTLSSPTSLLPPPPERKKKGGEAKLEGGLLFLFGNGHPIPLPFFPQKSKLKLRKKASELGWAQGRYYIPRPPIGTGGQRQFAVSRKKPSSSFISTLQRAALNYVRDGIYTACKKKLIWETMWLTSQCIGLQKKSGFRRKFF